MAVPESSAFSCLCSPWLQRRFPRRRLNRLPTATTPPATTEPTHANLLRGSYGPYRANNDLLFYHLDLRVDPDKKFISGTNTIRFKMLQDGTRIQLELHPALQIEKIAMGATTLKYERDGPHLLRGLPQHPAQRQDLLDRRSLLRKSHGDGTLRLLHLQKRHGGPSRGSTPPAKRPARMSGGRTKISGATSRRRAWRSASPCRTI